MRYEHLNTILYKSFLSISVSVCVNAPYVKEKWVYAFWSAGSDLGCSGINIICKLEPKYLQGLIEAITSIKIQESGHIRQLKHKPIVLLTLFCSANVTMKPRIKPSIPSYSVFGINAYCPFREWNADILPEKYSQKYYHAYNQS